MTGYFYLLFLHTLQMLTVLVLLVACGYSDGKDIDGIDML